MLARKAKSLITSINKSGIIHWNSRVEFTVHGQMIHGSNNVDLVNDVLGTRKANPPIGWEPFSHVLFDMNTPREYALNPQRWLRVKQLQATYGSKKFNAVTPTNGSRPTSDKRLPSHLFVPPSQLQNAAVRRPPPAGRSPPAGQILLPQLAAQADHILDPVNDENRDATYPIEFWKMKTGYI
jgi:hypothetical protein